MFFQVLLTPVYNPRIISSNHTHSFSDLDQPVTNLLT